MQFSTIALSLLAAAGAVSASCKGCHTIDNDANTPYFVMNYNKATGFSLPAKLSWTGVKSTGSCSLIANIKGVHPKMEAAPGTTVDVFEDAKKIGSFEYSPGQSTNSIIASFPCKADNKFEFRVPEGSDSGSMAFTQQKDSGIFLRAC